MYDYAIRFEEDSAPGLAMFCRELPELNSYSDDRESAISEALDAIETTLSIYVDQRRVIPVASAPEAGEHVVRLPAVTVAKIALWNAMMERDMRKTDLCRLLGVHQAQGDRLVDFLHTSKIEQLETALKAFDLRLSVTVQPYHIHYEVKYIQNGERKSFECLNNVWLSDDHARVVVLSNLKLPLPQQPEGQTPEEVCRAHGISEASIKAA